MVALAIIVERAWTLRESRVVPGELVVEVWQLVRARRMDARELEQLRQGSPLGRILAAALSARALEREQMKESIEEVGRHVVHELERYLNTLATLAAVTPLLGLLGTVIGMIKVFAVITTRGVGDPGVLAGGISEALLTTAAGLFVAIPSLLAYRYFRGRVDDYVIAMEREALKMIEALQEEQRRVRAEVAPAGEPEPAPG